jgi:hypothetical protein
MFWSAMILAHIVICLAALSEAASLAMTPRARAWWIALVVLAPVFGVAAFVLLGRWKWGGGPRGWFGSAEGGLGGGEDDATRGVAGLGQKRR